MLKKVSFSSTIVDIAKYAEHHNDIEHSIRLYFSEDSPYFQKRFVGCSRDEVNEEMHDRLDELEKASSLTILAALEAAFRVDYLQRCYRKEKDDLSRALRELHRNKNIKASLEDDILEIWKQNTIGASNLIGDLRGAFKFRHWLAHGRYWTPKLGRRYDYATVYHLAATALKSFPFLEL